MCKHSVYKYYGNGALFWTLADSNRNVPYLGQILIIVDIGYNCGHLVHVHVSFNLFLAITVPLSMLLQPKLQDFLERNMAHVLLGALVCM